jgi:hypothetical protein
MKRSRTINDFSNVATANIRRSKFDRTHTHKTTFDANYLIPVLVDEVLPGDTFKLETTNFCRLATPIKPSMDNLFLDVHYFFVPNRLVWDNWERFMGAQDNPGDSTDYLVPTITQAYTSETDHLNTIWDYMGSPFPGDGKSVKLNELPLRAYNLIWNEWFRDQNLQDSAEVPKGDAAGTVVFTLLKRGKRHDYFTSALPFPQKGEPVGLSLSGDAPVVYKDDDDGTERTINRVFTGGTNDIERIQVNPDYPADANILVSQAALLDNVTAVTINQLRQAFQLQKFLERDARSGTRYIEVIKSHFGVTNPDFRLQRPEFLGSTHEDLRFTTIPQSTQTLTDTTPQGNLAAMATASGKQHVFNKSFTEHGYIIGLASVYADLTYQQGLNRMWWRQTRVDYYWPVFAHLGEQEIFNGEIYYQGDAIDNALFGYQERYAEYRYHPNRISGEFRSTASTSLDVWHYAEEFANLPTLSSQFIENNAPVKRNSAIPSEPDIIADFYFKMDCVRPMPMFGTPGFVDHF